MILTLLASFLGGLILNISPCMISVIALKIMSFIKMGAGHARTHGMLYSAGLFVSFLILGAIVAILHSFGTFVAFGEWSLGSVWYNAALAAILGLIGTRSLIKDTYTWAAIRSAFRKSFKCLQRRSRGEAPLTGRLTSFLSSNIQWLKARSPHLSSFLYGVLTTLMGSACCGPLLASAMGAALALSPTTILLAFSFAGLGMASPYIVLSLFPKLLKLIPRSGKWVLYVQRITGALILLTGAWFAWLATF